MSILITTKFLGPTDHRGSRVSAKSSLYRLTVPWDYELGIEANHDRAVLALSYKMAWGGGMKIESRAETHDKSGYAYIVSREATEPASAPCKTPEQV